MVDLDSALDAIAQRYNREYRGEPIDLPPEVEAELAKPKKKQICLDLGCGISFLIYPWREWDAVFYGQEISSAAQEILNARGPQLNSKLFKGVRLAPAHRLDYDGMQFDVAIATGFSCYYSLEYWERVLSAVRKVMKREGVFVFDVVDETQQAENWAILETYLGAEVLLEPISAWKKLIKASGARIVKEQAGEIFRLFKVKW